MHIPRQEQQNMAAAVTSSHVAIAVFVIM